MVWKRAAAMAELESGARLFKDPPRQIALFRHGAQVYAVDNRCPHEGYPLVEGSVSVAAGRRAEDGASADGQGADGQGAGCVLTCNWHNWKFQLADGKCLLGGDDVRSYPVELRDGDVWVDVSDPPPAEIEARVLKGLRIAYEEQDYGRIARELGRLHAHGLDPSVGLRGVLEWSHDRFEYGTTHAYAASADWLALAARAEGDWERQLVCLTEAVDHISHDALRHPPYPFAEPGEAFEPEAFARAIEDEDRAAAEGMLRRALDDGLHWSDLEPSFASAALAHFNDFGHSAIWVLKAGQWIERDPSAERWLLPPLTRSLCFTTREDLIPDFRDYAGSLARMPPLEGATRFDGPSAADGELADRLFGASVSRALDAVLTAASGATIHTLYDALMETSARHLAHFEMQYQADTHRPVNQNVGWLDFTHAVTFGNAVRHLCARFPALWPQGLLQMACFTGRNAAFLDRELDLGPWSVADPGAFWGDVHERLLDHGLRDPIFSAHLIKTSLAVEEEWPLASPSCRAALLTALARFLGSPIKQKHGRRLVKQAIALVGRDFA